MDAPVLQVWKPTPGSWKWATLPITDYLTLEAEIRHLDFGFLSFSLPAEHEAVAELTGSDAIYGGRLATVEWKGQRFGTFSADRFVLSQESDGRLRYELTAGPGVLEFLTWPLVWPNPASSPANQTREADYYPSATTDTAAETVVQYYIAVNFRDRWAAATNWTTPTVGASQTPPIVAASLGRGTSVRGRGRYQPLWQLVEEAARVGGIGISMGLVNVTPVSAQLTVSFYMPTNRALSARFSTDLGTIRSWEYATIPPTVTRTLAGRPDYTAGLYAVNARTETSVVPPGPWAGHREQFVPTTSTTAAFDSRDGLEELAAGRAKGTFDLDVVDGEGMGYGVDYFLGDTVGVDVGSVAVNDTVSAVALSVTDAGGVRLRPIIGDPDATRPPLNNRQVMRALTRRTNNLERR